MGRLRRNRENGVTLIELMMSIALIGVLLAVGVPSFQGLVENSRVSTALAALESVLKLARTEAVKRNSEVLVCRRLDDTRCADGATWEGLLVFDVEREELIRVVSSFGPDLEYRQAPESGIRFEGSGLTGASTSFQLMLDGHCERIVNVSATGNISVSDCP